MGKSPRSTGHLVSGLAAATGALVGHLAQGRSSLEMPERSLALGSLRAGRVAGDDAFGMSPSFHGNHGLVDLLMKSVLPGFLPWALHPGSGLSGVARPGFTPRLPGKPSRLPTESQLSGPHRWRLPSWWPSCRYSDGRTFPGSPVFCPALLRVSRAHLRLSRLNRKTGGVKKTTAALITRAPGAGLRLPRRSRP